MGRGSLDLEKVSSSSWKLIPEFKSLEYARLALTYLDVLEGAQLLIPDSCQVQSLVAGEGYLWNISL